MKLSRLERQKLIRTHTDKTTSELAALLGISERTVIRDRKQLKPEIPDGAVSDNPVENLRQQQQTLRESLKALAVGSEAFRKTVGSIAALEMNIAKLTKPTANETDWEFVCLMDAGSGLISTRPLKDCSDEVKAHYSSSSSI